MARKQETARVAWGAAAACTLLAIVDALVGDRAILIVLLVLGPLFAATRASPRQTAWVAAYTVVLAVVLGVVDDIFGDIQHLVRVGAVLGVGMSAVWIAWLRTGLEREQRRAAFLFDAGLEFDKSLDYKRAAETITRLAVPYLGDWAAVFTRTENGSIEQLSVEHRDPSKAEVSRELQSRYPPHLDQPIGVGKVIRTGEPDLLPVVSNEALEAGAENETHAQMLRGLGLRSAMVVPMRARDVTFGALALATAESERTYDEGQLALARKFSQRAAMALDNARLYTQVTAAEADLRTSAEELEAILSGVTSAITVQDPSGKLVYANQAAAERLGAPSVEALLATPIPQIMERFELFDEQRMPFDLERLPGRQAMLGNKPPDELVFFKDRESGQDHWSLVKATPIRDHRGNVSLVVNIFDDVTEQKRIEMDEKLLAEASRLLSASLDYETTLDNVAHLAVPLFADWCAVDIVDDRGELKQVALAHVDPSKIEMAERMRQRYPTDPRAERGAPQVLRSGEPELYPDIPDELLVEAAESDEHLSMLRSLGSRSAIVVPMSSSRQTFGVISFLTAESGRRFDQRDVDLAMELARRGGAAVENARLYAERSHIAQTLQRSLLPPVLPDIPGVEVAARFRPAGAGFDVGGDFYDVFNTGAGWGIVIGDVCGKGPEAAALTGLARHTLRTAAMQTDQPSRILGMLSEAIRREHSDSQFCTAVYGRLELDEVGARLTLASGGHPPPLMVREDGTVEEIAVNGALLGSFAETELEDLRIDLPPGSTVVLYTDGVIEAGEPRGAFGIEGLRALLSACSGLGANEVAERIDTAIVGLSKEPPDDVALLVLRVRE